MADRTALIVDDEPDIRELIEMSLATMGVKVRAAGDLADAHRLLARHRFDVCITDMRLPDGDGIELVRHIQSAHPDLPTAVITAYGNVEKAVQALKAGAFDFVSKPVDLEVLRRLVGTALRLAPEDAGAKARAEATLLGQSEAMERVRRMTRKLARSQAPIYISGESGTGKELAARLIHESGPRSHGPFVPVNCGAIPDHLVESEFFGYRKGAFTGATRDKEGLFQSASGGTLFLDEVADLPLDMQVKLLRAIQERAVRPIGDHREYPIDVRILSATHKNLADLVRDSMFRQDLFYRLNVIELHMPPLRERPEDIPELADHILKRLAREWETGKPTLAEDALEALLDFPFYGNVRELENILERAMTLSEVELIHAADLHLPSTSERFEEDDEDLEEDEEAEPGASRAARMPQRGEQDLETFLEQVEKDAILKALQATRYNKTAAARKLGISFRALRYRLKKIGIE
jgi:two-component system response regulator PilR (NtrC family)